MTNAHFYEVISKWDIFIIVILCALGKAKNIKASTPLELPSEIGEKWTIDHLFVAALKPSLVISLI